MTSQTLPARHATPTRSLGATLAGLAFVVAVLGGGATAAQNWLEATCPTTPALTDVCATVLGE